MEGQASRPAGDQRGELGDGGPVVDVRGRVEGADGVGDGDLRAVGAIVEGEELGVLFAVGGVDEVRFGPVDVVFVAGFDVAADEAIAEVGVGAGGVDRVVFVEAVGELLSVGAAEEGARLVGGEDVGRGVVLAACLTTDQLAIRVRGRLRRHERDLAAAVVGEAV